jgi:hypothetical protein
MPSARDWPQTPWSSIRQLRASDPSLAREALRRILEAYYEPILGYMRRHADGDQAEEWAHAFVEKLIAEQTPAKADPVRPLHRYLIAAMRNFVFDQHRRGQAATLVRGGALDAAAALARSAEHFHREWAERLVTQAIKRLQAETTGPPKGPDAEDMLILRLRYGVDGEPHAHSYDEIRARLGRAAQNHEIDNSLRRTRKALLTALRAEARLLLDSDSDTDDELWRLTQYL